MAAVILIATAINFLLSSLNSGIEVVRFIVYIREVHISDIDYPLGEKSMLLRSALLNASFIHSWAASFPVSKTRRCQIPRLFTLSGDIAQRSHRHLEGLGPLGRSTADNRRTVYAVDRGRG